MCTVCARDRYQDANRVFPKIDHSVRSDRIVLVEYTTGSVVELKFCKRFAKALPKISQGIGKIILNTW